MKTRKLVVATAAAIAAVSTCALFSQSASAQQYPGPLPYEVFLDTFSNGSTINTANVTPTSDSTDYAMTSTKGANATLTTGDLQMELPSSSSAYLEAAAVFTTTPVVLQNSGDAIDFIMVFTDTANLAPSSITQNQIGIGLFNSGGVYPVVTNMGTFTTTSGGVQTWTGYNSEIYNKSSSGTTTSKINSRPAQSAVLGGQDLLFNDTASSTYDNPRGSNLVNGSSSSTLVLTNGVQYTEDFQIRVTGSGTMLVTNTVFLGSGTGGTVEYTYGGTSNFTGSLSFDSLAFGFLEKSTLVETQDISEIDITTTIPEPSTWMLLAASLPVLLAVFSRRRRS